MRYYNLEYEMKYNLVIMLEEVLMQMFERIGFQCHVSPLYGPECQMVKINCLTLHFNLARVMLTARAARARPRQSRTWQMF